MKKMKWMEEDGEDENRAGCVIVERSRDCTFCNFSRWRVILAWKMTLIDEIGS
jgi:hypothetical protein